MDQTLTVTLILMAAGLVGCVVPLLAGPPLAWLGALYYGWQTAWQTITPLFLAFLLIIALVGATADWWMGILGAKRSGASAWGQVAAIVGGLVGLVFFSLPGMLVGSVAAIAAVEWQRQREWKSVLRAGGGYLVGYLLSIVIEIVCTVLIIGGFAARLWL